jgi:CheY-like chemotaxis protein
MNEILVVSSDKHFLQEIKADVYFGGFVLKTSSKTHRLFERIKSLRPDLLIIDFILNDENGGAICHRLKSDPETRYLPVILLTDYSGLHRFSSKFGCCAMLKKPVDRYDLLASIMDQLHLSGLEENAG